MLPSLGPKRLVEYLRRMLVIRRFEEGLIILQRTHDVGHFHVYVGQEATGVPALALLKRTDLAFSTHRNHGHVLARGADPGRRYAEILGRATGYNKGKGGTLHISVAALGLPTTSAVTGGNLPLATGAAFAFKELGDDRVAVALFGDGAIEEGAYHESLNIAALRGLPVVYFCENNSLEAPGQKANEYPSSTLAAVRLTDTAKVFGIPAVAVDGTDTRAVHLAMRRAVTRARKGGGPTFIEARTVRWPGNRPLWPALATGETDLAYAWDEDRIPDAHRTWYITRDGVLRFLREVLAAGHLDRAQVLALDADVRARNDAALRFALESPMPDPSEALLDVFA